MSLDIQPSLINNQPNTVNQLILPVGINPIMEVERYYLIQLV